MPVADLAEARKEVVVGHDVATFAEDGLDEDGGDVLGRDQTLEQLAGDEIEARLRAVRRVVDPGQHRPEAMVVPRLRGGHGHRAVRPSVERAEEGDEVLAARGVAGQLHGDLDGLRARVRQERPIRAARRGDAVQLAADLGVDRQVEVGRGKMEELLGLALDRAHDLRMGVAGGCDRDAGGEVEEQVPVDVLEDEPIAARGHDVIGARKAGRRVTRVHRDDRTPLGAGDLGHEIGNGAVAGDPRTGRRIYLVGLRGALRQLGHRASFMHEPYAVCMPGQSSRAGRPGSGGQSPSAGGRRLRLRERARPTSPSRGGASPR